MARLKCWATDGWPNAPTLRAPFSRWWESAATTASDISNAYQHAIGASVKYQSWPPPRRVTLRIPHGLDLEPVTLGDEADARSTEAAHWRALQMQTAPPQS